MTVSEVLKGFKNPIKFLQSDKKNILANAHMVGQYNKPIVRLSYNKYGKLSPIKKATYGYKPQNYIKPVKDKAKSKKKKEYKLPSLPKKIVKESVKKCPSGKILNVNTNRCIKKKLSKKDSLKILLKKIL
jgi:hypothetical protein